MFGPEMDDALERYYDREATKRGEAADPEASPPAPEVDLDSLTPTEYEGIYIDPDGNPYQLYLDATGEPALDPVEFDDDAGDVEEFTEFEQQLAQHFLQESGGDEEEAYARFTAFQEVLGQHGELREVLEVLEEAGSEITPDELEDWRTSHDVDSDVAETFITKASALISAGDVDSDDPLEVADALLEHTREQEAEALRPQRYTKAATGKSWDANLKDALDAHMAKDDAPYKAAPAEVTTAAGPQDLGSQRRMGDELENVIKAELESQDIQQRGKAAVQDRVRRSQLT